MIKYEFFNISSKNLEKKNNIRKNKRTHEALRASILDFQ